MRMTTMGQFLHVYAWWLPCNTAAIELQGFSRLISIMGAHIPAAGCPRANRLSASSLYCDCSAVVLLDRNPGRIRTGLLLPLDLAPSVLVSLLSALLLPLCMLACARRKRRRSPAPGCLQVCGSVI